MSKRGRGATKIEQEGLVRTIGEEHGQPILRLPKALNELGVYFGQEVIVQKVVANNPLGWELVVKPKIDDEEEKKGRAVDESE